jgi:hypothetical protein
MNPQAIPEAENSADSGSRTTPRDEAGAPRITVSRGDLAAAVAHAGRALPKRAALPVLTQCQRLSGETVEDWPRD